jgi:hypothetical protein
MPNVTLNTPSTVPSTAPTLSLAQLYARIDSKSFHSRSASEIYAALDEAGFAVYTAVLKEFRGTFLKVDETSLTLTPNVNEYTLPADLTQIVHLAERQTSSENWHPMPTEGLGVALDNAQASAFPLVNFGDDSDFSYYGPYLDSDNAVGAQLQKVRVSPAPTDTRFVQIAYTAKWLPIFNAQSQVMLPQEGWYAMEAYATAECLRSNDDTLAREYEGKGDKHLTRFLTWMRQRQVQQRPTITPYLG